METINKVVLKNESIYPDHEVLRDALNGSFSSYLKFMDILEENDLSHEWRFYNDGKSWLCKIQKKRKTVVWLSVWDGFFKAVIYYPLRIIDEVYNCGISNEVIEYIRETKNVGKSKPCIFEVGEGFDFSDFIKVMKLKMKG